MKIINLTSHTLRNTLTGEEFKPSGRVLRANVRNEVLEEYDDLHVVVPHYSLQGKLPDQLPNTVYVVSNMALNAIPKHRTDFVGPGAVEKDENNRPIGCRGFSRPSA